MYNKSVVLVCCLFVFALAIFGCGGGGGGGNPAGPVLTPGATASLSGTVLFNNTPTAFASVYLYKSEKAHTVGIAQMPALKGSLLAQQIIGDGAYSTTTDGEGVYSFNNIPVGQYTLIAVRDENHQFVQTGVLLGQVTTLNPQLTPTGKITGKVTLSIGGTAQAISGVFVYINGTSYIAVSDTAGNFTINNVPSNSLSGGAAYEILVSSTRGTASPVTGVVVSPGATTNIGTIAMTAPPQTSYATLNGTMVPGKEVTDVSGLFVILTHQTSGSIFGTHTNATGKFQFRVVETGNYLILSPEKDYDFTPDPLLITVSELSNAALTLSPITADAGQILDTGSIAGIVTLSGAPLAGAVVHASGTSLIGVSNAEGKFIINKVPANDTATPYTLEVSSNRGAAPAKTNIVVNVGQTTDAGVFAIALPTTGYKTITGQLVAVSPVTTSMLGNRLVQLTSPDGKVIAAYSGSTGAFSFITTQTGIHTATAMDRDFIYNLRTQNITVSALDNGSLSLPAINVSVTDNTGSISGQVTAGGSPVTGAIISISGTSLVGVSNNAGSFLISGVPANSSTNPYAIDVTSDRGISAPMTGIVVTAGNDTNVGAIPVSLPEAGYRYITGQLSGVAPLTVDMLTNTLIQMQAPDGKISSAYTNNAGAFTFITAQTGPHNVTIIDSQYVYSPKTQTTTVAVLDNGSQALPSVSVSNPNYQAKVSGTLVKTIKIKPEVNESGIAVFLTSLPEGTPRFNTFTDENGSFTLMVPPGNYALSIGNPYTLDNPATGDPVAIAGDYTYPGTILVRPVTTINSIVEGTVSWPAVGWEFTEGEIILENPTFFERRIVSNISPALFRFESVPPGSYVLRTNPLRNGYVGSMSITITEGIDLTGQSLTSTFIAPMIMMIADPGETMSIGVMNLVSDPAAIEVLADNQSLTILSLSTITNTCDVDISSLSPGSHTVQIIKTIAEGKLAGNRTEFVKPLAPPTNIATSTTDRSVRISWQNAPSVTEVELDLYEVMVPNPLKIGETTRVVGTSHTFSNLTSGTEYFVRIRSRYNNLLSGYAPDALFRTETTGIDNIASSTLTGTSGQMVFDFEVYDNTAYIAIQNDLGLPITLLAYPNMTSPPTTLNIVASSSSYPRFCSLAADANGVYLTYADPDGNIALTQFNKDTLGVVASRSLSIDYGFTSPSMATVRSFNNRVFLTTRDGVDVKVCELSPLSLDVVASATIFAYNSLTVKSADLAHDPVTNTLYLANLGPGESGGNVEIRAFANMNLNIANPPLVGVLDEYTNQELTVVEACNNLIFCARYNYDYNIHSRIIDARSGFVHDISNATSFGSDRQNRIWIDFNSEVATNNAFTLLDNGLSIQQTLPDAVYDVDKNLNRIRLDHATGMMYMLFRDYITNNLTVYRYNSNY